MTVEGFTRDRRHQFGRQSAMHTPVPAVKAYPFSGVPTPDLAWTDRQIDVGSIDLLVAPIRGAPNLTASLTDPGVEYNSLPLKFAAIFGGGVTPTGTTAKTWHWGPASTTVDAVDVFTYEFGDDVDSDWYQLADGLLESLEFAGPEGGGAFTGVDTWRFGHFGSTGSTDAPVTGSVPTDLTVDKDGALWYLKDTAIYIASTTAGLATGQVSDALHSCTLKIGGTVDQKRFANGSQSFDIDAYGRSQRLIEVGLHFAKTADTVGTGSESDAWTSDAAVDRYVEIKGTSVLEADTGVPYSVDIVMPLRYYTRAEGATGGNSAIDLNGRAFYDADDLGGVMTVDVVCTQATI